MYALWLNEILRDLMIENNVQPLQSSEWNYFVVIGMDASAPFIVSSTKKKIAFSALSAANKSISMVLFVCWNTPQKKKPNKFLVLHTSCMFIFCWPKLMYCTRSSNILHTLRIHWMNGMKADYIRIPRTHIRHSCIQFHINKFQLPRARFSLPQNEQNEKTPSMVFSLPEPLNTLCLIIRCWHKSFNLRIYAPCKPTESICVACELRLFETKQVTMLFSGSVFHTTCVCNR